MIIILFYKNYICRVLFILITWSDFVYIENHQTVLMCNVMYLALGICSSKDTN